MRYIDSFFQSWDKMLWADWLVGWLAGWLVGMR